MALKPRSGMGYIILNIQRGLNILALLLVIVANGIMMFKTSKRPGFFVFDQFTHVSTSAICIFLVVSELDLWDTLRQYFATNWPMLGLAHGFSTLGLAMIVLGCSTLGNLTKDWLSRDALGSRFWTPIAVAGIVVMTAGLLSIALSLIFTDRKNGISAREVRVYGATASSKSHLPKYSSSMRSAPSTKYSTSSRTSTWRRSQQGTGGLPPYHASSPLDPSTSSAPRPAAPVISGPFPMSREEVDDYVRKHGSSGGSGPSPISRPKSIFHPSRHGTS